jgi:hypothetical protein
MERAVNHQVRTCSVSVVVPYYRKADSVHRALDSVARQTVLPAEVIVVDDEVSPASEAVLRDLQTKNWPFPIQLIRMPENTGPASARNAGWHSAMPSSRYIAFLDADDLWLPCKLEMQTSWMDRHPSIHWTAHRIANQRSASAPQTSIARDIVATPVTMLQLLTRNPVATPTVMVVRHGGPRFRDSWRYCEDLMLWTDLTTSNLPGSMIELPLAVLGRPPRSPGGASSDIECMHAGERRVIDILSMENKLPLWSAFVLRMIDWLRYRYRLSVSR